MPFTEHAASLCLLTLAFSSFPIQTAVDLGIILSPLPQKSKKDSIVGRGLHSASKINVGVKRDIQIHVKVQELVWGCNSVSGKGKWQTFH